MASPPSIYASGASQTTGGILHGQAHADGPDPVFVGPCTEKVFVYQSPRAPDPKKSETSIKCEVTPQIKPVLKALAWSFLQGNSKKLSHRQLWQAFVQESIHSIASASEINLELQDGLAINDVTREHFLSWVKMD